MVKTKHPKTKCPVCGSKFEKPTKRRVYCSASCRAIEFYKRIKSDTGISYKTLLRRRKIRKARKRTKSKGAK